MVSPKPASVLKFLRKNKENQELERHMGTPKPAKVLKFLRFFNHTSIRRTKSIQIPYVFLIGCSKSIEIPYVFDLNISVASI